MHIHSFSRLACPSCRCTYDTHIKAATDFSITQAVLTCPQCGISVPIIAGFPLFNEARPAIEDNDDWLAGLEAQISDEDGQYQSFLQEKASRGNTDLYAAFQPFNESTRAIYPLLTLLQETLQPGDIILDTWCRTGWSGELLASLFPQNRVISIWEGNSNVLGYKGFHYWLNEKNRLPNLDIIFTHPDHALPLASNSVRVIHGLDSLHRYRHSSFIPECLRVCEKNGVLIFPHIHLSNSQPKPFFERGCFQYHGREWKAWLDKTLNNTSRCGWVLPEVDLFEVQTGLKLSDQCNTEHYNGFVLIADKSQDGRELQPYNHPPLTADSRLLLNPLVEINLHQCTVKFNARNLSGLASTMMQRHPCYAQKLERVIGERLNTNEASILWHAQHGLTLQAIANTMQLNLADVTSAAQQLCERELIHPACVSSSMAALQTFYTQVSLPGNTPDNFAELWQESIKKYEQNSLLHWLEDESELTIEDATYLVDAIRSQLANDNIQAGSHILIASNHHPEALLLCWAAWLQGIVTAIVDVNMTATQLEQLNNKVSSTCLFTDNLVLAKSVSGKCVYFDKDDAPAEIAFSNWLEASLDKTPPAPVTEPEADAVILFTSGSTGTPKGVVLSHRALCNSGYNMAQTHGWHKEVLLSLGPLSMMSGLRNPAVSALVSGSKILIPGRSSTQIPLNAWTQACTQNVSVITAVPAWLQGLMSTEDRLLNIPTLKQILLTGTNLDPSLFNRARKRLGITIGNYYGLTESGGICSATLNENDIGTLGYPANALLQIVDTDEQPVLDNKQGTLRVCSNQLMSRYFNDPAATEKVMQHGWFITGDIAHWDHAGRLVIDGRQDESLKLRNGARFHPQELESILTDLPEIEAAAVTVMGDEVHLIAFVVTNSLPNDIHKALTGKVANHLLPDKILVVPELPRNSNGKLVRSDLAKLIIQ